MTTRDKLIKALNNLANSDDISNMSDDNKNPVTQIINNLIANINHLSPNQTWEISPRLNNFLRTMYEQVEVINNSDQSTQAASFAYFYNLATALWEAISFGIDFTRYNCNLLRNPNDENSSLVYMLTDIVYDNNPIYNYTNQNYRKKIEQEELNFPDISQFSFAPIDMIGGMISELKESYFAS